MGYPVKFLVGDFGQQKIEICDQVTVIKVSYSNPDRYRSKFTRMIGRICYWKELLLIEADVLITSTASEHLAYMALIGKKLRRKRILFRVAHDWDVNGIFIMKNKIVGALYHFGLRNVDQIVAQNFNQQETLKKTEGLDSIVIRNGFPILTSSSPQPRSYFLWIARADHFKRPHLLLELAKNIPQERFIMIFPGTNQLKNEIVKRSRELSNVDIIDEVSLDQIQPYFEKAKCFINTSESEGFPNSFIQSCLASTPLLSFNVNPENIITDYQLGCFCHDQINEAIVFLKSLTPQEIERYGVNAYHYVLQKHNIEDKILEYKKIIEKLTDRK